MNNNSFEIQLPLFAGFYESVLYNSDTLYNEVHNEDSLEYYRELFNDDTLVEDDLEIDLPRYKKDVCEAFVSLFSEYCTDVVCNMEFLELTSPHDYNGNSDKLYVKVTFNDDWRNKMLSFMDENKAELHEIIRRDWSDVDGFWSFLPNSFNQWYKNIQTNTRPDVRIIANMLGYMVSKEIKDNNLNENEPYFVLNVGALDNIYINEYIINLKDKKIDNEFGNQKTKLYNIYER